jgi:hypothetical protein
MPLYALQCLNGHGRDEYCPTAKDKGCRTHLCQTCGNSMGHVLSVGRGLTWMEEGRARTFHNIAHDPVTVTSYKAHEDAMKRHEVQLLPPRYGEKGSWV